MSNNNEKILIVLKSSDGQSFEVEEAVAMRSGTIKHMIEDDCADGGIPIPNVTGAILAKVIEFCTKHDRSSSDDHVELLKLKAWDANFAAAMDQNTLYDMLIAANYLEVKDLLELLCQTVADLIKGKKPEEIRQHFNIKNDFTAEEEEEIRRENQWAFE